MSDKNAALNAAKEEAIIEEELRRTAPDYVVYPGVPR